MILDIFYNTIVLKTIGQNMTNCNISFMISTFPACHESPSTTLPDNSEKSYIRMSNGAVEIQGIFLP